MFDKIVPTTKIKAENSRGYRIINASEFNPAVHERYEPESRVNPVIEPEEPATPTIGKGPRGLWYVRLDGKPISNGYATEDEAMIAKDQMEIGG
jgi:hypothetical protein